MTGDEIAADNLRTLARDAAALADKVAAGQLWPGQLQDQVRALAHQVRDLERYVTPARDFRDFNRRWPQ